MTRVCHLFGNWKWTGPADPTLTLVGHLGSNAELLLGPCPHSDLTNQVAERARERGIHYRVLSNLSKHSHPVRAVRAPAELVEALRDSPPDVLHVHFDADHAAAARAREFLRGRPAVVRSVHEARPIGQRRRRLLESAHLLIAPSPRLATWLEQSLGRPAGSVAVVEVGVDQERFRFDEERRQRGRNALGLEPEEFAVGIVARIQRHRRYELLLEAWRRLSTAGGCPRLVVLGRGTHEDELVRTPVQELGLTGRVILPGYQAGDAYLDGLAACDAGILLVPGSDVSCRAVREWMAFGRGVLATHRDPLPELVTNGKDGVLVPEDADAIAAAFLGSDAVDRWRGFGEAALATARRRFSMQRMVERTRRLYRAATVSRPGACETWDQPIAAVAVAGAGDLDRIEDWACDDDVIVLQPGSSRDVVIDTLSLIRRSGARRLLLAPHREWDGPFLDELRSRDLEITLLDTEDASVQGRWLERRIGEPASSSAPD